MPHYLRWTFGLSLVALLTVIPILRHRAVYTHSKRLREVTPGRVYRSGQMTAVGFADAISRFNIRTVLDLQDEHREPDVRLSFFNGETIKEQELCRQLGVRYVQLTPDLISRRRIPAERPRAIERFLEIMDDPATYPVLIHCRAGLHRTGVLVGVYRMEYEGWSKHAALAEIKAVGFGEAACTSANDYIKQYVLTYQPGLRRTLVSGR